MQVRPFQLSDYVSVTQLLSDVLSDVCYEDTMKAFARQLSWDSELVLVAEEDDEVTGIVIGTIDDNKGYHYRIAVGTAHQRKGIGRTLVKSMQQKFQQRNVKKILVNADSHNEAILPLYVSMGYDASDFFRPVQPLNLANA